MEENSLEKRREDLETYMKEHPIRSGIRSILEPGYLTRVSLKTRPRSENLSSTISELSVLAGIEIAKLALYASIGYNLYQTFK